MQTYSLYIGTDLESTSYDLSDQSQFNEVLDKLQDNEVGYIDPFDIRDSILSLWSNCVFKETKSGSDYYIGIDTGNPSDRDFKSKILIGKGNYYDEFLYTSDMDNNDVDVYFTNTKLDTDNNNEFKLSILSGDNSSLFINSPYISAQFVSDVSKISFNIINEYGSINIKSDSGTVSLNNIFIPTILDSQSNDIDGKLLQLSPSGLEWGEVSSFLGNTAGTQSDSLDIYGYVYVNGYPLEFTDDRKVSAPVGSVLMGESFDKLPLNEMLKRIVYSYQSPLCSISILPPYDSGIIEVGTTPTIEISYKINKKTLPTTTTVLYNMIPSSYPPITSNSFEEINGIANGLLIPSPALPGTQSYEISVSDGLESNSFGIDLSIVYPFFYGVGINNNPNYSGMSFLIKLIELPSNKSIEIIGSGNIYIIYPQDYGTLDKIINDSSVDVISDFTLSSIIYSSPDGNWSSKPYYLYKSDNLFVFNSPVIYSFEF